MSHGLQFLTETNPNDVTGGGGCVCSPEKQPDCQPPYVVFPGNDMENPRSPHVVICARCVQLAAEEVDTGVPPVDAVSVEEIVDDSPDI